MRYVEKITLNAGVGTLATNVFYANSIYDPNFTGTGHQPRGHDEWGGFYHHYRVLGSRITVKFENRDSGAPVMGGVLLNGDTTLATGTNVETALIEQGKTRYAIMGTSDNSIKTVKYSYSGKKYWPGGVMNRDDQKALFGNNPGDGVYYHVWCSGTKTADDPGGVQAYVIIDYVVMLEEPKDLPES